jgi:hypothetical protein
VVHSRTYRVVLLLLMVGNVHGHDASSSAMLSNFTLHQKSPNDCICDNDGDVTFAWSNYALYATDSPNVTAMDDSPMHSPSSKHANLMVAPDVKLLKEWAQKNGVPGVLNLEKTLPFAHRIWTNSIRPPSEGWSCAPTPKINGPEPRRILCPHWRHAVADVVSAVVSARSAIKGVMIGDELVMGHFPLSNLTALAAALHDGLAPHGIFLWTNEGFRAGPESAGRCTTAADCDMHLFGSGAGAPVCATFPDKDAGGHKYCNQPQWTEMPAGLDVVSLDVYNRGAAEVKVAKQYYGHYLLPLLKPHQRLWLVPGLYGPNGTDSPGR